jgi:hypothetical protein
LLSGGTNLEFGFLKLIFWEIWPLENQEKLLFCHVEKIHLVKIHPKKKHYMIVLPTLLDYTFN